MNWGFDHDKCSNFSYDKAKACENGDCDNCEQCDEYYWNKGYADGEKARRSLGWTKGAEWYADQNDLKGSAKDSYIAGFNEALDECP